MIGQILTENKLTELWRNKWKRKWKRKIRKRREKMMRVRIQGFKDNIARRYWKINLNFDKFFKSS